MREELAWQMYDVPQCRYIGCGDICLQDDCDVCLASPRWRELDDDLLFPKRRSFALVILWMILIGTTLRACEVIW